MIRQLALHNLLLMLQYAVGSLIPLLLVPHVVHELGLAAYGQLAMAMAMGTFAAAVVQYAFPVTGPQRLAQLVPGEAAETVVLGIASAKLVLLGASIPVLLLVAYAWSSAGDGIGLAHAVVLLSLPAAAALNTGWHLQSIGRFAAMLFVSGIGVSIALVVGFLGVRSGRDGAVLAAAIGLTAAPLIAGAGTLAASLAALGKGRIQIRWQPPWRELRGGFQLFLSQLAAALYVSSGPIVIGLLRDAEQAGTYGALERVATAVIIGCLLVHTAAYPKLAQLYAANRGRYLRLLKYVIVAYLLLSGCVSGVAIAFESALTAFLYGPQATGTGLLIRIALVWLMLGIFGPALVGYLVVSGRGERVLGLTLRILAVVLCLGVPGVVLFGAWAWMAALVTSQLLVLSDGWQAWRREHEHLRDEVRTGTRAPAGGGADTVGAHRAPAG